MGSGRIALSDLGWMGEGVIVYAHLAKKLNLDTAPIGNRAPKLQPICRRSIGNATNTMHWCGDVGLGEGWAGTCGFG